MLKQLPEVVEFHLKNAAFTFSYVGMQFIIHHRKWVELQWLWNPSPVNEDTITEQCKT
jgi:hypothetical protein